jgi:hypothetical protein
MKTVVKRPIEDVKKVLRTGGIAIAGQTESF